MIARPCPAALLVLLSVTSSLRFASGLIDQTGHSPSRVTAQIAHHTELPYLREPVEPSNFVDGPLPGGEHVSTSPSADADAATTTGSDNDEYNGVDIALVPQPVMQPGYHYAAATQAAPVPYEHPHPPPQYGLSHQWYRLSNRPVYEVKKFKCDFDHHTCGMRNQKNIGPHFKHVSNLFSRPGHSMAVDSQRVPPGVSRLITPYLPGYPNAIVCLQLSYIVYGPGAEQIQVVAQDFGNRPLFTLLKDGHSWRTFGINITVQQDVRFFIEAYTNGRPGIVAIDDFTYSFEPCR